MKLIIHNVLRGILAALLVFAESTGAAPVPVETDELVGSADLIVIAQIPTVTFGLAKLPDFEAPVQTARCTAKIVDVLKGKAPERLQIVQYVTRDSSRVLVEGDWIIFLQQRDGEFQVCAELIPINDQKARWYAAHFRRPTKDEQARMPVGTVVAPKFSKQPIEKVAEDIRAIARRLEK